MTYNQLVYDCLEILRANGITDDQDIDFRHVLYNINIQRELWLNNEYNKPGRSIDSSIIQPLGCAELITADEAECCNVISNCKILRTKEKIPQPVVFNDGIELRVGPNKLTNIAFSLKGINEIPFVRYNKYAKNMMYCFYYNNYLYFIGDNDSDNMIDSVKIWGVFSDPEEAATFNNCEGTNCFSYDDEYPIKGKLIPYIVGEVIKKFGISLSIEKDDANNAKG
jgi:hypothetical protein